MKAVITLHSTLLCLYGLNVISHTNYARASSLLSVWPFLHKASSCSLQARPQQYAEAALM